MEKLFPSNKRILFTLIVFLIAISITGCKQQSNINATSVEQKDVKKYEEAVARVEKTRLSVGGSYAVTENLIIALENAEYTEAKNIIYMIGDGMGFNIIDIAEHYYAEELYQGILPMNYLPLLGSQSTYSANSEVTDSAAGATALATGYKTDNAVVAMNTECTENYETVLELAAEQGKSTGIVVTKSVTDATPAAFTSHVDNRGKMQEVARQQMEKLLDGSLDLVLGGGYSYYEDATNSEMLHKVKEQGISYSRHWNDIRKNKLPLIGLLAADDIKTTNTDMPTLAEMTNLALERLSEDEDGFFLMVEGSKIDTYGHSNDLEAEARELYYFNQAIAVAMRYVALHPDTVLIITADHETGGLLLSEEEEPAGTYTTGNHTSQAVPVYALGYRTEELDTVKENVDIGIFVASLLGKDDFGRKSERHLALDTSDKAQKKTLRNTNTNISRRKGCAEVTITEKNNEFRILLQKLTVDVETIKNARAIHIVLKNCSEKDVASPGLIITIEESGRQYRIPGEYKYLKAGEKAQLTYVVPMELWNGFDWSQVNDLTLGFSWLSENDRLDLELYEVYITDRALKN